MGAEYNDGSLLKTEYPTKTRVKVFLDDLIENAKYEYGHRGYTGSFAEATGVSIIDKHFDSIEEATDWLIDNAPKWGNIYVVSTQTHWVYGAVCAS